MDRPAFQPADGHNNAQDNEVEESRNNQNLHHQQQQGNEIHRMVVSDADGDGKEGEQSTNANNNEDGSDNRQNQNQNEASNNDFNANGQQLNSSTNLSISTASQSNQQRQETPGDAPPHYPPTQQHQQQQQQQPPPTPPFGWTPTGQPFPNGQPIPPSWLQYYEARMRDHAAAYASAAAGAAWAAAQLAASVANGGAASMSGQIPAHAIPPPMWPSPPPTPHLSMYGPPQIPSPAQSPHFYDPSLASPSFPQTPNNEHGCNAANGPEHQSTSVPPNPHHFSFPDVQQLQQPQSMSPQLPYPFYPSYPPPQPHQQHQHQQPPPMPSPSGSFGEGWTDYGHRRKRQQRMPPSEERGMLKDPNANMMRHNRTTNGSLSPSPSNNNNNNNNNNNTSHNNRRRQRPFRTDGSSGGDTDSGPSTNKRGQHYHHKSSRSRHNKFAKYNSASDGGGGSSGINGTTQYQPQHPKKKKQRQPINDESLLGKTGVSALYEWCGKRRLTPTFSLLITESNEDGLTSHASESPCFGEDDFEMAVYVNGKEWGRGRGRTKAAAKQEASRRALQSLCPGVSFDEANGILMALPTTATAAASARTYSHQETSKAATATSLEDLAPNLAKRLAIGRDDDDDNAGEEADSSNKRHRAFQSQRQVSSSRVISSWNRIYPGTTTTTTSSEEEDENQYYASRGASVCSALLHAMVQIDSRIPEPPSYTYEVSTVPNSNNPTKQLKPPVFATTNAQLKRKKGEPNQPEESPTSPSPASSIVIHRGSFTCTAQLKLRTRRRLHPNDTNVNNNNDDDDDGAASTKAAADTQWKLDSDNVDGANCEYKVTTLEAKGVSSTKREARHIASAKLLALLFPECNNMVEVKQAAEAARERYAASKALKQQSKRDRGFMPDSKRQTHNETSAESSLGEKSSSSSSAVSNITFALASSGDPPMPSGIVSQLRNMLGNRYSSTLASQSDAYAAPTCFIQGQDGGSIARQASRQKQLDDRVAVALQTLNEHDEEGRSLPGEVTVDDVGRTVLRRAGPEDSRWVEKLLGNEGNETSKSEICHSPSSTSIIMAHSPTFGVFKGDSTTSMSTASPSLEPCHMNNDKHTPVTGLSSAPTIVLLLCRAIAPFDDPPLGCAVLTFGFSMEKGRLLRIAQISSEPHLPRERFLECLQAFAGCMGCTLEISTISTSSNATKPTTIASKKCVRYQDVGVVVDSYLASCPPSPSFGDQNHSPPLLADGNSIIISSNHHYHRRHRSVNDVPSNCSPELLAPALQSVKEESEGAEESDAGTEKRNSKTADKPSKRSRVQ